MLSKVKVSGGGRCNVTHSCFDNRDLVKNYPRGEKELLQVFAKFSVQQTIDWFKEQGVVFKTEADGRMFPYSNNSQTIIDCFLRLVDELHIKIKLSCEVLSIEKINNEFSLKTTHGVLQAHKIICALGGHNKIAAYQLLNDLGHTVVAPIPSLFTLNFPNENIKKELQGVAVEQVEVKLENSKINYQGPVLITHWGLSGPAVLKLSAFGAKEFYTREYQTGIVVNWVFPLKLIEVEKLLKAHQKEKHKALPYSHPMFKLPRRLWEFLCEASGIYNEKPWAEINNKTLSKLATNLFAGRFYMHGKTTFKEEFVTCGGVDLKEIDFRTMESKLVPGLFFCGEVINIDGITGGFNFQNAWSTAWICANSV